MKNLKLPLILTSALVPAFQGVSAEVERPNILWLTFEDTSTYAFGCYGNEFVTTPNADALAARGVKFTNAYSIGPQSSPARSTLITGSYATTYGMDLHRSRVGTPADIFFPKYLAEAGYYCTNNVKTDYNSAQRSYCWDECTNKATYNSEKRGKDQPFFAVFNTQISHMSRMTSVHLEGRRDFAKEGLDPATLPLPPHVPDTEEMRSDYAFHLEGANDVDRWLKIFLDDLDERGLADDTIIFFFSDHGGCLPRGKGFSYESSFRVPMIVYIPEKWQHLSDMKMGESSDRMVSFVDIAPTVLSLAGIEIPEYMQGLAFMGEQEAEEREYQFGVASNQASHFMAQRTASDGKMKYIRRFIPFKNDNLLNEFQWQLPSNMSWDKFYFEGNATTHAERAPFIVSEPELLFDLDNDPWELNNLASDPAYKAELERMRGVLADHMRSTVDLGLFPRNARQYKESFYDYIRDNNYDMEALFQIAELTATVTKDDIPQLCKVVKSGDKACQYWAVVNFIELAIHGNLPNPPKELLALLSGKNVTDIGLEAAHAIFYTSQRDVAVDYLARNVERSHLVLEQLSYDREGWKSIPEEVVVEIRRLAALDNSEVSSSVRSRKILVNIGEIPANDLFSTFRDAEGLKTNKNRRPLIPIP